MTLDLHDQIQKSQQSSNEILNDFNSNNTK